MMMRQGGPNNNKNQRPRGRGNGGGYQGGGQQQRRPNGNGSPNRMASFDSNGPDVRIRGNAYQVHEKYVALARDASVAGDRVLVESYYQHAEHYYRIINADNYGPNGERRENFRQEGTNQDPQQDYQDGEGQGEGGEQGYRDERAEGYRENRQEPRADSYRENRQDGNYRTERPQQPERQYQERQNLADLPQPDLPITTGVAVGETVARPPQDMNEGQGEPEATVERRRRHPRQVMPEDAVPEDEQPEV